MDGRIDYTALYLSHNINFRDIPLSELNDKILMEAAIRDGKDYVNVIFKLYEIDNNTEQFYIRNGDIYDKMKGV